MGGLFQSMFFFSRAVVDVRYVMARPTKGLMQEILDDVGVGGGDVVYFSLYLSDRERLEAVLGVIPPPPAPLVLTWAPRDAEYICTYLGDKKASTARSAFGDKSLGSEVE